jgi:hypothetical protein
MQIQKKLYWLKEYIELVRQIIPEVDRITLVREIKSKKKKEKHEYSKIDLLGHLAHEMAHLKYWTHTPEHKMLECKLTVIFMRHLLKSGYVSEEEEIIERRKNR